MSDNPFQASGSTAPVSDDPEFDQQLARMWMGRTWGVVGTAVGLAVLSYCCNPFGVVGLIAAASGVGAIVRCFSASTDVKPHLGADHMVAVGLSVLALLLAIGRLGLSLMVL